jgi:membrane associated rhomboid family serine protease
VSAPELSVVCKSCGSEVSPYVTECPYCGARLRKRAPKLQRGGEGLEPRPKRRRRVKFGRPSFGALDSSRPYATIAVIAASALVLLVGRATGDNLYELGGIASPFLQHLGIGAAVGSDWWRYLTAPFAYTDTGYLFVVALGLVIFGPGLERRLGTVATLILLLACGALGMLAANAIDPKNGLLLFGPGAPTFTSHPLSDSGDSSLPGFLAGGNGMALGALGAWTALRYSETRRAIDEDFDLIGVTVCACALLLLPLVDAEANIFAGLIGGLVGGAAGFAAAAVRPRSEI